MKLNLTEPDKPQRTVEGAEARHALRSVLQAISNDIWMPEMPYTGRVRCRIKKRLREGEIVWSHADRFGQPTARSTYISLPMTLVGVIDEKGKLHRL